MSDNVHLIPTDDLVKHEANEECVCMPQPQFEDGGIVYIHSSLDGRELTEEPS